MGAILRTSLLAIVSSVLVACEEMPSDPEKRRAWVEENASRFEPKLTQGFTSTTIGNKMLAQKGWEVDPDKLRVSFVYEIEKTKWVEYALSRHANYRSLILYTGFELRKNLCKEVFNSSLHTNGLTVGILIRVKDDNDYHTWFTKDGCMQYL
jgi:hypothetical protein